MILDICVQPKKTPKKLSPRIFVRSRHDPGALFQIKDRFNIAFAGHLHGGQIFLPGIGPIITPGRAPRSWAKHEWIDFEFGSLFVSSGIGTSILPLRVNVPPEFVIAKFKPSR